MFHVLQTRAKAPAVGMTMMAMSVLVTAPLSALEGGEIDIRTIEDCASIEAANVRLACYDAFARTKAVKFSYVDPAKVPLKAVASRQASADETPQSTVTKDSAAATGAAPSSNAQTAAAEAADLGPAVTVTIRKEEESVEDTFGKEAVRQEKEPEEDRRITATVVNFKCAQRNLRCVFELDNGQIWMQSGSDRWKGPKKAPFGVTVKKALFGSYSLVPDKGRALVKVRRFK